MRRRDFIARIAGSAAAWPLAARAQPAGKQGTIGFLGAATASGQRHHVAGFLAGVRELGWVEGRNAVVDVRWAEGRSERYSDIAAEFVRLKVDVIVTFAAPAVLAAKRTTSIIPIVFAASNDPVGR